MLSFTSKMSRTYISRAVPGMSCMRPLAPLEDTAKRSKLLSAWTTARTSGRGILYLAEARAIHSSMRESAMTRGGGASVLLDATWEGRPSFRALTLVGGTLV